MLKSTYQVDMENQWKQVEYSPYKANCRIAKLILNAFIISYILHFSIFQLLLMPFESYIEYGEY